MGRMREYFRVDPQVLPIKIHYFLSAGGASAGQSYRPVYARHLGISATATGVIFLICPFAKILTNPLVGFTADFFKAFKLLVILMTFILASSFIALVFIPPVNITIRRNDTAELLPLKNIYNYTCPKNMTMKHFNQFSHVLETDDKQLSCKLVCRASSSEKNTFLTSGFETFDSISTDFGSTTFLGNFSLSAFKSSFSLDPVNLNNNSDFYSTISSHLKSCDKYEYKRYVKNDSSEIRANVNTDYSNKNNDHSKIVEDRCFMAEDESIWLLMRIGSVGTNVWYRRGKEMDNFKDSVEDKTCGAELTCFLQHCKSDLEFKSESTNETSESSREVLLQFWCMLIFSVVSTASVAAVEFLSDTICCEMLRDRAGDFGKQRMWGTCAWGLFCFLGGCLNNVASQDSINTDYSPSFYMSSAILVLSMIHFTRIKVPEIHYSSHILHDIGKVLTNCQVIVSMLIVCMVGALSGFMWTYQFWLMEEMSSSQLVIGLSQIFDYIISCVPWYLASGWLIHTFGYANCNSIVFVSFALKFVCFAYMMNPWMALPAGLLTGPTYALFVPCMTHYRKSISPPGTEATVQSMLALCFDGIGTGLGSILGGVCFDKVGGRMSFLYAALASIAFLIFNVIQQLIYKTVKGQDSMSTEKKKSITEVKETELQYAKSPEKEIVRMLSNVENGIGTENVIKY